MIWDPHALHDEPQRSAVVAHIASEVGAVCGGVLSGPESVEEMARAVEQFLEQTGAGEAVDANYLVMLASQALSSLGENGAARRLLLFGSGLVRPSEWEVSGDRAMWVLDLKQIAVREDAALELILFNSLNMILDAIADVWDASRGDGVLGLRHVCQSATLLLGAPTAPQVARLSEEIKTACVRRLERLESARGWSRHPDVMDLDG